MIGIFGGDLQFSRYLGVFCKHVFSGSGFSQHTSFTPFLGEQLFPVLPGRERLLDEPKISFSRTKL
jgi:hypothetical protein